MLCLLSDAISLRSRCLPCEYVHLSPSQFAIEQRVNVHLKLLYLANLFASKARSVRALCARLGTRGK